MPADILVRRATAADVSAMVPLIDAHAAFERATAHVSPAALAEALSSDVLIGWVAQSSGTIVGYATATVDFSTWRSRSFLHLDCLFVTTGCRNAGIGLKLIEAAKEYAIGTGLEDMQWQTPAWNHAASRFYRRLDAAGALKLRFALHLPNKTDGGT